MEPKDYELLDITVEEFDALDGVHEFSKEYKKQKKKMLKEFRRSISGVQRRRFARLAMAASLLIIVASAATYATAGTGFFNEIWGNAGKSDIDSHDEEVYDAEKGTTSIVTYPKRDYVETDEDKAEELIGDNVSHEKIVQKIGDTTLTILSAVTDGTGSVVEYTLEREGGVNALGYSQLDNESKGAWFSDDSTFWFHFKECSGNIFVDLDKSTEEKLYCYEYMAHIFDSAWTYGLHLEVEEYPCTRGEMTDAFNHDSSMYDQYMMETKRTTLLIPLKETVKKVEYVNADGGTASISPLSLTVDMGTGLGLSGDAASDPGSMYYLSVNYKDGTNYIVLERNTNKHSCDVEVDNSSYGCGDKGCNVIHIFNRLVDISQVSSITVNETSYTLK